IVSGPPPPPSEPPQPSDQVRPADGIDEEAVAGQHAPGRLGVDLEEQASRTGWWSKPYSAPPSALTVDQLPRAAHEVGVDMRLEDMGDAEAEAPRSVEVDVDIRARVDHRCGSHRVVADEI